jgi:hypothetical protein
LVNPRREQEAILISIVLEKETPLQIRLNEILKDIPVTDRIQPHGSLQVHFEAEIATELARIGISHIQTSGREIMIWVANNVIIPLFVSWLHDRLRGSDISSIKVGDNQVQLDQKALVEAIAREQAKLIGRRRKTVRTRRSGRTKRTQRRRMI